MTKKKSLFGRIRWDGLILIGAGLFVSFIKQTSECAWYNIFCSAQNIVFSSTTTIIGVGLMLLGGYLMIKK